MTGPCGSDVSDASRREITLTSVDLSLLADQGRKPHPQRVPVAVGPLIRDALLYESPDNRILDGRPQQIGRQSPGDSGSPRSVVPDPWLACIWQFRGLDALSFALSRQGDIVKEEGWYTDPYRLHDARWFSDGTPTALVRDAGVTSKDPPPNTPYLDQPEPVPEKPSSVDEIRRADEAEKDSDRVQDAIWTIFTKSGPT